MFDFQYVTDLVIMSVSKLGKMNLIFVDPGMNISGTSYRDMLLTEQLLPVMGEISGEFIFQQDSFSHTELARQSAFWNGDTTSAFISPDLWPRQSRSEPG